MSSTRPRRIPGARRPPAFALTALLAAGLTAGMAACAPDEPDLPADRPAMEEPTQEDGPALEPTPEGVPGLLVGIVGEEPAVALPDTVTQGETFTVSVTTYGRNGCWRQGETEVSRDGMTATVRPYDQEPAGDQMCTQAIQEFVHEAPLAFPGAGTATVVVEGRSGDGGAVSFTREVVVTAGG